MKAMIRFVNLALFAVLFMGIPGNAFPQGYPNKPVRMIIPFQERGAVDVIAYPLCQKLSGLWAQTVIYAYHPGAGGTVGAGVAAKSPPDGYTLMVNNSSLLMNAALITSLAYDPMRDFVPIAPLVSMPFFLVVGKPARINTVAELIAAVKAKPGELTFGSSGEPGRSHLGAEKFNLEADIKAMHVPSRSMSKAIAETIAGRVTYLLLPGAPSFLTPVREGKLTALAVTSTQRSSVLPEIPTVAEAGLAGFDYTEWYGMWAPIGTPADIVDKIGYDVARALAAPDLRILFMTMGLEPVRMAPAEFARFLATESESTARVVKAAGIKFR